MYTLKEIGLEEICRHRAWALYRLQSLPASKLIKVVNRILSGDDVLINPIAKNEKE